MSTGQDPDSGQYEIRVRGHLESRWAAWFDGMTLTHESDGTTSIHGPVVDQAALHGAAAASCATPACRWSRSRRSTPTSRTSTDQPVDPGRNAT